MCNAFCTCDAICDCLAICTSYSFGDHVVRSANEKGDVIEFYQDGDLVGVIDYSHKSKHYREDAVSNWLDDIMSVETVERHSLWNAVKN